MSMESDVEKAKKYPSRVDYIEDNIIQPIFTAILSLSINLPLIDVVERQFALLKKKEDFNHCISLLTGAKSLVDNPQKVVDSIEPINFASEIPEEVIESYLNSIFMMPKELLNSFPPSFSEQALRFSIRASSAEFLPTLTVYRNYFNTLATRLSPLARKHGLHLSVDFSTCEKIYIPLSSQVLIAVYDFLVDEECLYADQETRDAFLALFANMGRIPTGYKIKWRKTTVTTGETNMHQLYVTLWTLGVNLENKEIRNLVESKFIGCHGEPITLKKRESKRTDLFQQRLKQVIQTNLEKVAQSE